MHSGRTHLSLACCLVLVMSGGCAATSITSRTIDVGAMRQTVESPASLKFSLEPGERIEVFTNRKISVSEQNYRYLVMVVRDASSTELEGELVSASSSLGDKIVVLSNQSIVIKLEDIDRINVLSWKYKIDPEGIQDVWGLFVLLLIV